MRKNTQKAGNVSVWGVHFGVGISGLSEWYADAPTPYDGVRGAKKSGARQQGAKGRGTQGEGVYKKQKGAQRVVAVACHTQLT